MKKDIEWFMEQMKSMTRMRDLASKPESWYISEGALLEALNELDDPETIEETTHLLESVLKENKRLGELLEEKHEEWLDLMGKINNQETLSQGWIDKNVVHVRGLGDIIKAEAVENLLVPKQRITGEQFVNYTMDNDLVVFEKEALEDRDENIIEEYIKNKVVIEKPVIPQFVAEVIEEHKGFGYDVYDSIDLIIETNGGGLPSLSDWVARNIDKYARAWLNGFTVEEEQKYVLSINITDKDSKTNYKTFLNKRGIFHSMDNESFNSEEFNWSEEEIKDLENGEILFEHFAVKVEELK